MWVNKKKYKHTLETLEYFNDYKKKYADAIREHKNNAIRKEINTTMNRLLENFEIIEVKKKEFEVQLLGYKTRYCAEVILKSKTKIKSIIHETTKFDYYDIMEWIKRTEEQWQ